MAFGSIRCTAIAASLLIVGCSETKRDEVFAACWMNAVHTYGPQPELAKQEKYDKQFDNYLYMCMQSRGYKISYKQENCPTTTEFGSSKAECYEHTGWW